MFDEKKKVKKISCYCPFQLSDISDISLLLSHREWVTALCMFVPRCITMHFFTSKIIPQVEAKSVRYQHSGAGPPYPLVT